LASQLWGINENLPMQERKYGHGRIINKKSPRQVLADDDILPDFEFQSRQDDTKIDFIHRRITNRNKDVDIYFVINSREYWEEINCTFRINDRIPEIWDPSNGEIYEQLVYKITNGRLTMPLQLPPFGSAFVVFRKPVDQVYITSIARNEENIFPKNKNSATHSPILTIKPHGKNRIILETWQDGEYVFNTSDEQKIHTTVSLPQHSIDIGGPWKINFPRGMGAPDSITINRLISWTEFPVDGIKYYSGTATYESEFRIKKALLDQNTQFYIDLGSVKDLAEISLNRKKLPVLWKEPFRLNITSRLRSGPNRLEIEITNLWPNRLIGDQWLPKEERYTFTNIGKFTKDSPLRESGLLGPVKIYTIPQVILPIK
jgi:hypothetical protein